MAIAWSSNGKHLATGGYGAFGIIPHSIVASTSLTMEPTWSNEVYYQASRFTTLAVGWSPDCTRIARGGAHRFDVWDVAKQSTVFVDRLPSNRVKAVEYSPNGKWIVAGGFNNLRLYTADPVQLVREFDTTGTTTRVSFSPNSERLAVASGSGFVELFSVPDGQRQGESTGHVQDVFSVDWHPQDDRIATGSSDGTVRLWDAITLQQALAFEEEGTPILSVEWSIDGKSLASVSSGNGLRVRHAKTLAE